MKAPLVPLGLFRLRNISVSNVIAVLWAASMFAWFFLSALYMQQVLGYSPLQVGMAFLPANLIMGAFSYSLSAKLVNRFGIRRPLAAGLACATAGLVLFALAPANGSFVLHVLPAMLLLGVGAGMAFNPVLLAAMSDVEPKDSGLASGIVNTSFMMGGSLGLAVLASLAAARTNSWLAQSASTPEALTAGYSLAFMVGAGWSAVAAALGLLLRERPHGEAPGTVGNHALTFGRDAPMLRGAGTSGQNQTLRMLSTGSSLDDHRDSNGGLHMAIQFNHTILYARDSRASASFLAEILGLPAPTHWGPFEMVTTANGANLDYMDTDGTVTPQHYAFLVSDAEFDEVFGRIQKRKLSYWADPGQQQEGKINHHDGGRGVYFEDPNGHLLEIITRPYGSGGWNP